MTPNCLLSNQGIIERRLDMGKKNQEFCFRLKMCINIQEHSLTQVNRIRIQERDEL